MIGSLFLFAFPNKPYENWFKSMLASFVQVLFRLMMFNLDFRISFFSGIGAFSRSHSLIGFLEAQKATSTELKSSKRFFYQHLIKKSRVGKLYMALLPFFPGPEVSIFSAGEQANNIKKATDVAISFISLSKLLKDKIKVFVTVIVAYFALFIAFIVLLSKMISDAIAGLVDQMKGGIPESTQMFIDFQMFIESYLVFILIALVAAVITFIYRLPRGHGKMRKYLHEYVPGFRLYRRYVSCSFLLSLSAMLGSGMPFHEAVGVVGKTSKKYLKSHTDAIIKKLNGGASQSKALEVGLLPLEMYLNVSQFIGGNSVEDALFDVSRYEMDRLIRQVAGYQKRVMFLLLGIGGFLAVKGYSAAVEPALALIKEAY